MLLVSDVLMSVFQMFGPGAPDSLRIWAFFSFPVEASAAGDRFSGLFCAGHEYYTIIWDWDEHP